ncbi:MAG TPA: alpha/beta fold hydrolase [Clostridia bacterium]|nr:alpha/beta fold hydrolase [Clostridia bacterium]
MAIVRKEAYFNSSTGVDSIRTLIWQEEDIKPCALFQIAHGVCEHIGRYDDFARFLASHGFVVFGNDHLGHGKSVADESGLGFTAEKDGHIRFVDDMHILTGIMKKRFPDLPLILFGHSMGSFCARVYAGIFKNELDGLILCGTGHIPPALDFAAITAGDVAERFGSRYLIEKFALIANKFASLLIPQKEDDLDWLSISRENIENYKNDPLCGIALTLAGVRDLISIGLLASAPEWAKSIPENLPIMIVSGAKDPIGLNGTGVLTVANKLENTGHTVEVILYPRLRHEILNEETDGKVYSDILKWSFDALSSTRED